MGMNPPSPERVHPTSWRKLAPTVGDMIEQRWEVIAACTTCGVKLRVDLKLIARERKPSAVLWNATTPCKVVCCPGRMRFLAKPPQLNWHMTLEAEWAGG